MIPKITYSLAFTLALTMALSACASEAPYGPAASSASSGYTQKSLEEGRYRVTYRARTAEAARDGALRRAAEITLGDGAEWFQIVHAYSEGTAAQPRTSVGIGGHSGGGGSGVGVGIGMSFPLGGGSSYEHSFEFIVGSGERPEGGDVYDARSLFRVAG
ncbi:MAG: hypothetical protein EP340_06410 [Alphaproteobacteria bacterium]|nr:MAG: hypothetical protein EP340_06410 [Alphaproteobacteria bacterium]